MDFVRYRDLWFRIVACALAAHFVVMFGVKESFFEVLVKGIYHIPMLSSFLIAFLLVSYVRYTCRYLDRRLDWQQQTLLRIPVQILGGVVIPGLMAFGLAFFYFKARGYNILHTSYLRFDYPVILLLILLVNVYYLVYYVIVRLQQADIQIPMVPAATEETGRAFLVSFGARNIPVPVDDIAYFFRSDNNYLRTVSGSDYLVAQSLDEIEIQLEGNNFFRANRQLLVAHKSCIHYESLPYNKLELFVNPEYKEPVIVSQKRSRAFKEWLSR